MRPVDCPWEAADRVLAEIPADVRLIFVDFHAEASSEKQAFAYYLDGKVAAVVGTHTHVPTADDRVLTRGTAYLTDAGMCGPYASVLGREVEPVIDSFIDGRKRRFEVAESDVRICGCVIDVDPTSGLAMQIERVEVTGNR